MSPVTTVPGPMAFTRMPYGASEIAMALVSWRTAPFEAP